MTLEDMICIRGWSEESYVCGLGLEPGSGFLRFEWQDEMVVLCSMECAEAFQQRPIFYVTRRQTRELLHCDRSKRRAAA